MGEKQKYSLGFKLLHIQATFTAIITHSHFMGWSWLAALVVTFTCTMQNAISVGFFPHRKFPFQIKKGWNYFNQDQYILL